MLFICQFIQVADCISNSFFLLIWCYYRILSHCLSDKLLKVSQSFVHILLIFRLVCKFSLILQQLDVKSVINSSIVIILTSFAVAWKWSSFHLFCSLWLCIIKFDWSLICSLTIRQLNFVFASLAIKIWQRILIKWYWFWVCKHALLLIHIIALLIYFKSLEIIFWGILKNFLPKVTFHGDLDL